MILLTKLDGTEFAVNSDLIETMEEKPDTTIRLTTKTYYIVRESMGEIIRKITLFIRDCAGLPGISGNNI